MILIILSHSNLFSQDSLRSNAKHFEDKLHFFSEGKISVKIMAKDMHNELYEFYNRQNTKVYTLEKFSPPGGHMSVQLIFRTDGSVEYVKTKVNPGASMYFSEGIIYFDDNNSPTKMTTSQIPCDRLPCQTHFVWNSSQKKWELEK